MSQEVFFKANEASWDQRTTVHEKSEFYDLEGFKAGKSSLNQIELEGLGAVDGLSLLHLQCHFGQDTLSWGRMGAEVTAIDFSEKAIQLARKLSEELDIPATFHRCNVYDTRQHVTEQFDRVFTSYGVLGWLPDMEAWADVVVESLKPGGIFYIAEFHPTLYMYDFDSQKPTFSYFDVGPEQEVTEGTYTDREAPIKTTTYFWQHSLHEIMRPLLQRGLQLLDFQEFDYSPYNCFPNMTEVEAGKYRFGPVDLHIPQVFSLKMKKV